MQLSLVPHGRSRDRAQYNMCVSAGPRGDAPHRRQLVPGGAAATGARCGGGEPKTIGATDSINHGTRYEKS